MSILDHKRNKKNMGYNMVEKPSWEGILINNFEKGSYDWVIFTSAYRKSYSMNDAEFAEYIYNAILEYADKHNMTDEEVLESHQEVLGRRTEAVKKFMPGVFVHVKTDKKN